MESDPQHVRGKQLRLQDIKLHVRGPEKILTNERRVIRVSTNGRRVLKVLTNERRVLPEGDDLVEGVDQSWEDEVNPEEGSSCDPLEACDRSNVKLGASDWPIVEVHWLIVITYNTGL